MATISTVGENNKEHPQNRTCNRLKACLRKDIAAAGFIIIACAVCAALQIPEAFDFKGSVFIA